MPDLVLGCNFFLGTLLLSSNRIVNDVVNKLVQDCNFAQQATLGDKEFPVGHAESPGRDGLGIVEGRRELGLLMLERVDVLAKEKLGGCVHSKSAEQALWGIEGGDVLVFVEKP